MTNDIEFSAPRRISLGALPWLLAAGALVLYLATINHWVSVLNIANVARTTGWVWQPELSHPAYFLLTLPVSWLPEVWAPFAVNAFSALCAALVILQLTRTVALLPQDRTHEQREREGSDGSVFSGTLSWIPPIIAAVLCGLQLSFWEHATNGSTEMLDLLMFSFVIRALLEFRYRGRERWLYRAAFVFCVGMACNVAMVAFFPLFLAALIWVRGISFFNTRFLGRALIYGLLGLSFYLILPLVASIKSPEITGFWTALKQVVATQKQMLFPAKDQISMALPFRTIVLLALPTLVPIFVISIRWASYFGDASQTGQAMTTVVFHFVHAFFLGLAIWLALDPPFGPRSKGNPYTFLPLYYLGALGAGYFSAYFLLVFGPRIERRMRRPPTPILDQIHKLSVAAVLLLLIGTPVALITRNWNEIRLTNGPMLKDYTASIVESLPSRALVISDDPFRQFLVQCYLAQQGRAKDFILLNSDWLKWDSYHQHLHQHYGQAWPAPAKVEGRAAFQPVNLISLLSQISKTNQIYYLHPSFGYYFEAFYAIPHGLVYELKPYPENQLLPPPFTPQVVAANEAFFSKLADSVISRIVPITELELNANQYVGTGPLRKIRLRKYQNLTALAIGMHLSRALNTWGVEHQRLGELKSAARWFELANRLNRGNVVATRNLEFNRKLQAHESQSVSIPKSAEDLFGSGRSWDQVLSANGPYDEPGLCLVQGLLMKDTGLYRQAAQCFDRVRDFSPTDFQSRRWLAWLHLLARQPYQAITISQSLLAAPEKYGMDYSNRLDMVLIQTTSLFAQNNPTGAVALIEREITASPTNDVLISSAFTLYTQNGRNPEALGLVERQLTKRPDDATLLLSKSSLQISMTNYDGAISTLNRILSREATNASALFNRAVAYERSGRLADAKVAYEGLQRQFPTAYQFFGYLGNVAIAQNDTNAAIKFTESFLANAPRDAAEYSMMLERLRVLKGEKAK